MKPSKLLVLVHQELHISSGCPSRTFILFYASRTVPTFVDIDSCQPTTDTCFLRVDCISITRHGEWPVIKFIHKWPWCNWTHRINEYLAWSMQPTIYWHNSTPRYPISQTINYSVISLYGIVVMIPTFLIYIYLKCIHIKNAFSSHLLI